MDEPLRMSRMHIARNDQQRSHRSCFGRSEQNGHHPTLPIAFRAVISSHVKLQHSFVYDEEMVCRGIEHKNPLFEYRGAGGAIGFVHSESFRASKSDFLEALEISS